MVPDILIENGQENEESSSSASTSSSTPSSDDESGVFDTRFDLLNRKEKFYVFVL